MSNNNNNNIDRAVADLFTNRFAPLAKSLTGATVSEVAIYLHSESDFVALQKPEHTFLARICWNTVLVPVISAWKDVVARQREVAETNEHVVNKRKALGEARTSVNATMECLLQHTRDYDNLLSQQQMRLSALNHAISRLTSLFPTTSNNTIIQHVQP